MDKREILDKAAEFLEMGCYSVDEETGSFLELDDRARTIFGIPLDETDLSKYSIASLYIFPAERVLKIKRLKDVRNKPVSNTLFLRINNKETLLFDQCWRDESGCVKGFITPITDKVFFPAMFEDFPMGVYELDDQNKFVYFNKKFSEIYGYSKTELIGERIDYLYVNSEEVNQFSEKVKTNGFAQAILKFKHKNSRNMDVETFTSRHFDFPDAQWGMIHDVTKRELYFRALDKMPTGYYFIEYDDFEKYGHQGRIEHCNEEYAHILGFGHKEELFGRDVAEFFADDEERKNYYKKIDESLANKTPIREHQLKIKDIHGKIIHISVDVHIIEENGKIIGREGTIRDISDKVELEKNFNEAKDNLERTTNDLNQLIHALLHPVIRFSGSTELLLQSVKTLKEVLKVNFPKENNPQKLGEALMARLDELVERNTVHFEEIYSDDKTYFSPPERHRYIVKQTFADKLKEIIRVFDYSLIKEDNMALLNRAITDTALWILDELINFEYFYKSEPEIDIDANFIDFLKGIVFKNIRQWADYLLDETESMKREVETLRVNIGLKKKKNQTFEKWDLIKILENTILHFKGAFDEKEIDIVFNPKGDLHARICKPEIDRVISNLLQNAQKYSYSGKGKFVKIIARELQPRNCVEISISSLGIPIKKEEIESGRIWEFGYRGELAKASDRGGSGIGLSDARRVIEEHHGTICIECKPVKHETDPPSYQLPWLTTISFTIPKFRR